MDRLLGSFLRGHCRLAVVVARLATVDDTADDHGDHRGDQPGEALLRQGDHVHDLAQAVQIGSHRQNGVAHTDDTGRGYTELIHAVVGDPLVHQTQHGQYDADGIHDEEDGSHVVDDVLDAEGAEHSAHHAGDAHPQLVGNAALGDLVDDGGAGGADTDGGGEPRQKNK